MISHSPSVVHDGLVFAYDMANTKKSWKGKPTTNLAITVPYNPTVYAYVTGPVTTSNVDDADNIQRDVYRYTISSATNVARARISVSGLTVGVPYAFSCRWKYNGNNTSSPSFVIDPSKGNPEGSNNTFSANVQTNISLINGWVYSKCEFTLATSPTLGAYITFGISTGADAAYIGNTFDVYNIQFEQSTFATPFVNGTRSNTQAIVDLTGNHTVTATSLTYESDGTFSLGSSGNDYITIPKAALHGLTSWTINIWMRRDTSNSISTFLTCGSGNDFLWFFDPALTQLNFQNTVASTKSYSVTNGQPFLFTATGSGNIITVYKDGVSLGTMSNTTTITVNSTIGVIVGQEMDSQSGIFDSAQSFKGKIFSMHFYNRVLTAAEVQQNFNATRSRYGI